MASSPTVTKHFTDIEKGIKDDNHEHILNLANQILSEISGDNEAQGVKCVALMRLGKYDEALALCPNEMKFEKAYCLYRKNKSHEALQVLKAVNSDETRYRILEAQVNYRLENFAESATIFESLLQSSDLDERMKLEILTNFVAAKASAKEKMNLEDKRFKKTHELAFNVACVCIGQGDFASAESFLALSERLCRDSLEEEGASEEELVNELAPIQVQLAFVKQQLGKSEEAYEMYNTVIKSRPTDEAVKAVASNNVVSIKQDHQLFDSIKKLKTASGDAALQKLQSSQRKIIAFNNALLHFYTHKYQQCQEEVQSLQKEYPGNEFPYIIQAAITFSEKKTSKALEELEDARKKVSGEVILLPLTLAQLYLIEENLEKAASVLSTISNIEKYSLAVALLVLCYEKLGKLDQAFSLLDKISESENSVILEFSSSFLLKHKKGKEAAAILEKVVKRDPNNVKATSGLIKAYSYFDPKMAEQFGATLPSLPNVDVDSLEGMISKLSYKNFKALTKEDASKDSGAKQTPKEKEKKKRKKKKLLPKDLNAPVDPERWLPMKQRSYFKKSRKAKQKELSKGSSQGAALVPNLSPVPAKQKEKEKEKDVPKASTSSNSSSSSSSSSSKKKGKNKN